jgi:ElaB/YqjD/DUF883 family membrane-anchored ribosome-binding protein
LKSVVQDGEELIKASAQDLGDRGMAARERLSAALELANDTRRKLQARAVAGMQAGVKATDRVVRQYPYQSIGVAFGVGMLLGVLLNRK